MAMLRILVTVFFNGERIKDGVCLTGVGLDGGKIILTSRHNSTVLGRLLTGIPHLRFRGNSLPGVYL